MANAEVLIVGTGALACLFAARFSAAGIPLLMLGSWKDGLTALAEQGVHEIMEDGTERVYRVAVTSQAKDCFGIRYAIVLVKSWQTQRAGKQLAECLAGDGLALTLQNGLGNFETLGKCLGVNRVILGSLTAGAFLQAPGIVRPAGEGVITLSVHARLKPLVDLLGRAGFVIENDPDIYSIQWGKLVINAAINPITAILRVPNGELLTRPTARALLAAVAREAAAVAVARGVDLPFPDPVVAVEAIARRTGNNYSSMLQDVRRGAPSEIDAICGELVRVGAQTGVPTPINRTLQQLVKALVAQEAG
jgi:2-dehydropantoate 2-reductase